MGPQLDSCGREILAEVSEFLRALQWGRNLIVAEGKRLGDLHCVKSVLQWGRNLIVAEGAAAGPGAPTRSMLQWGRNLIVAEGGIRRRARPEWQSFNGAAT